MITDIIVRLVILLWMSATASGHEDTPAAARLWFEGNSTSQSFEFTLKEYGREGDRVAAQMQRVLSPHVVLTDWQVQMSTEARAGEGLQMTVHNPHTGVITFQKVFRLGLVFGHYLDLQWHVGRIQEGSVIVFMVCGSGMIGLRDAAITLQDLGSVLADHLPETAHWIWVFVKGGRTIIETAMLETQLPVTAHAPLLTYPQTRQYFEDSLEQRRWELCEVQEALGPFCDERHPASIRPEPQPLPHTDILDQIPVIMTGGTRIAYLYTALSALLKAPGLRKHNFKVFLGDTSPQVIELLNLMDIQYVETLVYGDGNVKLFQYYRSAYQYVADSYPEAPAAIFMDEDVELSPDYFSLMSQMIPLLRIDPTIYCVTGFGAASTQSFYGEDDKLKRVSSQVLWGYALTLDFIREALREWPTSRKYNVIYDLWMFDNVVDNRECVVPEMSRVRHFGAGQNTLGFDLEKFFLTTQLVNKTGIKITNLEEMPHKNWSKKIIRELQKATVLEGNPCEKGFFHNRPNGTYVFFYYLESDENGMYQIDNYFAIGECQNFWGQSDQGWHEAVTSLKPKPGIKLYLVGAPYSPYVDKLKLVPKTWDKAKLTEGEKARVFRHMMAYYDERKANIRKKSQDKRYMKDLFRNRGS
ncbi:protein O-linked-mannose beta-1,2-N-acetylglucosaminyltransferase 1 [Hyalella azteca]|uniref:Alpha-1,3-mannosyl-glycoprotein 2-beta-N-acetylglucosaminyltransferase n=1 Tax=Hyalella azteca TaxID=294128 RepID=A0A8B7N2D2_HYAAZ|nr:protein O-linked-mannose beta-1,2-N-acetylglucosaminyltransferase 1 [Hyalella azteca]